ncbi:hypothetical protein AMTRI_Chr13g86070 [Amborella trichopoda]
MFHQASAMTERKKHLFAILCALLLIFTISGSSSSFNLCCLLTAGLPSNFVHKGPSYPPVLAYWISGSHGDKRRILRLLKVVYHPRNQYLLHLDSEASVAEREELSREVHAFRVFMAFGNVDIIAKGDRVDFAGSSCLASMLHASSILLRVSSSWDWLITLTASDYPIVTQDDLLHVFSLVPRDLNFIDHTSDLGWKEDQRVCPIVVDPQLYLVKRYDIFHASERRPTPDAFKFFTGSPWLILSRVFVDFLVLGWDNLPRTLLMYFTNVLIANEGYFPTVICNSVDFQNKTVNSDLRHMVWDTPPKPKPHYLGVEDYDKMLESGYAFARQFKEDEPVLNEIDKRS